MMRVSYAIRSLRPLVPLLSDQLGATAQSLPMSAVRRKTGAAGRRFPPMDRSLRPGNPHGVGRPGAIGRARRTVGFGIAWRGLGGLPPPGAGEPPGGPFAEPALVIPNSGLRLSGAVLSASPRRAGAGSTGGCGAGGSWRPGRRWRPATGPSGRRGWPGRRGTRRRRGGM